MRTIILILLLPFLGVAQTDMSSLIEGTGFIYHEIEPDDGPPIVYISAEQKPTQKGILVFLQGSLPYPFFTLNEGYMRYSLEFPCYAFLEDYRIVMISKPGIAVVEHTDQLNENGWPVGADGLFRPTYQANNHLDYYVQTTQLVMDDVLKNSRFDEVILMGHSQGATVAVEVAAVNDRVSHLIFMNGGIEGRFHHLISEQREKVASGLISEEEAQSEINKWYDKWRTVVADPTNCSPLEGDTNKAWFSFSAGVKPSILRLDIPILLAYGTDDPVARSCDLLLLDFIKAGKTNLNLRPYPGCDHQFNRREEDGTTSKLFGTVIAESLDWVERNKH